MSHPTRDSTLQRADVQVLTMNPADPGLHELTPQSRQGYALALDSGATALHDKATTCANGAATLWLKRRKDMIKATDSLSTMPLLNRSLPDRVFGSDKLIRGHL